jgi:hypothetical protein
VITEADLRYSTHYIAGGKIQKKDLNDDLSIFTDVSSMQ